MLTSRRIKIPPKLYSISFNYFVSGVISLSSLLMHKSKSLQKEPDLDEVLELLTDKYKEAEQWDLTLWARAFLTFETPRGVFFARGL